VLRSDSSEIESANVQCSRVLVSPTSKLAIVEGIHLPDHVIGSFECSEAGTFEIDRARISCSCPRDELRERAPGSSVGECFTCIGNAIVGFPFVNGVSDLEHSDELFVDFGTEVSISGFGNTTFFCSIEKMRNSTVTILDTKFLFFPAGLPLSEHDVVRCGLAIHGDHPGHETRQKEGDGVSSYHLWVF
jgi:hypothetical protein